MATKLEGEGVNALVAGPLKNFFAASLTYLNGWHFPGEQCGLLHIRQVNILDTDLR